MSRSLTYHTDKLIALSGVAHVISEQTQAGLRYWAGLWDAGVLDRLYWIPKHVDYGHEPVPTRYGSYVAPSWSWASMDGEVVFGPQPMSLGAAGHVDQEKINQLPHTPTLGVIDGRIEPCGPDPYGQIRSGTLFVAGVLSRGLPVETYVEGANRLNYCFFHTRTTEGYVEQYEVRYDDIPPMMLVRDPDPRENENVQYRKPKAGGELVYCLRLYDHVLTGFGGKIVGIGALALNKTNGAENEYVRVGWVPAYDPAWFKGRAEQVLTLI